MTELFYNSVNVFSGVGIPTPLISRSQSMISAGERWGRLETIVAVGQFTGCFDYATIAQKQQQFLSGFKDNFKTLEIKETGAIIFSSQHVKVSDIVFGQSAYNALLPFEITFECYPSGYFSGTYGVLDPVDSFSFAEERDGVVSITHNIEAQGFVTNSSTSNALDNAKTWVQSRTGWNSQVTPRFITGFNGTLCLKSVSENKDRLNGRYGITETYLSDVYASGLAGILRYSTEFSSGLEDGICSMAVQGDIRGCRNDAIANLRTRYSNFNAHNVALNNFKKITNRTDLNSLPITKSVSEDSTHRLISFDYLFTDDLRPNIGAIYGFQFEYDYENDVVTCGASAEIFYRGTYTTTRWQELTAFADTINLLPLAQSAYAEYIASVAPHLAGFPLTDNLSSFSRSESPNSLVISLSASYNNKDVPPQGLEGLDYSLNFSPAIKKYSANPILNGTGQYYIFDLGFYRRANLSISLNALGETSDALSVAKNQVLALQNQYLIGTEKVLESQSFSSGNANFGKNISIEASYSAKQTGFLIV